MKKISFLFLIIVSFSFSISAQTNNLKPGFDTNEFKQILYANIQTNSDIGVANNFPKPEKLTRIYRSPSMCFDNRWDLWTDGNTGVVVIRGTAPTANGWLSNAHSVMLPAQGKIQLTENKYFEYKLATNPMASIHTGWLYSMAFISNDLLPRMDSLHKEGITQFIITGHSQGGVLSTLLTAHLLHLQIDNVLPRNIVFKTYTTAAPKPGNLYFAYDYESLTQEGMSYNVVNSLDWVPETPSSVQTFQNYNINNPFADADKLFKKQKLARRVALKIIYRKVNKPLHKSLKNQEKYLGKKLAKILGISNLDQPKYSHGSAYVRTGNSIVLTPDSSYHETFKDSTNTNNYFLHHSLKSYNYLIEQYIF